MSAPCDFCGSRRGVKSFPRYGSEPDDVKCQVCARLLGTDGGTTPKDVLSAIVALFHALDVLPHNSDDEVEGVEPQ